MPHDKPTTDDLPWSDDDAPPIPHDPYDEPELGRRSGPSKGWIATIAVFLAALAGAYLSATSTHDFARHLDGQVHAVSCSVLPGGQAQVGESGCKTAMMSPYSSIGRDRIWGGVPIALGGFAVFAFLAAIAAYLAWMPDRSRRESGWLLVATLVPAATSAVMAWISANKVGSYCDVCLGIYGASAAAFAFAVVATAQAERGHGKLPWGRWLLWTAEGVATVALLYAAWVAAAPSERPSLQGCGTLVAADEAKVLVPLAKPAGAVPALLVLDPLCPACRAFDGRLRDSGLDQRLAADLLLFPLDSSCNWMVKTSLHPGACAVSEAVLCAPQQADAILQWAFRDQPRLLALGKSDEAGLRAEIVKQFQGVSGCLGGAEVKAKLNKSLRFAVANALPVLTPQLYVGDTRLCDEDTDLGLEFALGHLLAKASKGGAR